MKAMYKVVLPVMLSVATLSASFQSIAAEVLGGGGSAAEELLLDWSNSKQISRAHTIKFSNSIASNDLANLKNGKIDFAILDESTSDAELARNNFQQIPFALNGVSIVVNLPNTQSNAIRLDGPTLGKIFSGEISTWNDSAITSLNPKHELPNKPITIIHSGEMSTDYSLFNKYIGSMNETWKAGDRSRTWPANAVKTDNFKARIYSIKSTPYSIGFLPMQYMRQSQLSVVHLKNKDGNFVGLSDTGIIASTAAASSQDGHSGSLLINNSGSASWPLSTYSFIVVQNDKIKDEKIAHLLSVVSYGLRLGALKTTVYNYVALPDQASKNTLAKIETLASASASAATSKPLPVKSNQDAAAQDDAAKKLDERNRQITDTKASAEEERKRLLEEKNRLAKQQAEELAREKAIKEAKEAKLAAEEAIKAAAAAKLQAEQLAEKNRQIAKAEKERADKEKADRERAEKEKERAIQLRNQKDEDPLEAYRRSVE